MTYTKPKGKTTVGHIKSGIYGGVDITRKSKWGNPFKIKKGGPTRREVIEQYRRWIHHPKRKKLKARIIPELKGRVLLCWCAPDPCHGDVLAAIANGDE